jgi:hypothetical protein
MHDYITKLCMQRAEIVRNHENVNARNTGQGEVLRGGQAYDCSSEQTAAAV